MIDLVYVKAGMSSSRGEMALLVANVDRAGASIITIYGNDRGDS